MKTITAKTQRQEAILFNALMDWKRDLKRRMKKAKKDGLWGCMHKAFQEYIDDFYDIEKQLLEQM